MSQRSALARFLFDAACFSNAANRRTWRTVVAAGAMLGSAYLARPALADEEAAAPPAIASSPTAAAAAEVSAAIGRPIRVAQAPVKKAPPTPGATSLAFDQPELDVGSVVAGSKKAVEFTFSNNGVTPVKLDRKMIKSSCPCLVVTPPKEPIPVSTKGMLKAVFTAPAKAGATSTTLTVTVAGIDTVLTVRSTVTPRPRPRVQHVRPSGRGFVLS